jgi:hypothetical protein
MKTKTAQQHQQTTNNKQQQQLLLLQKVSMDSATTISNSKTITTNNSSIINHITDLLNENPIDLEITVLTTAGEEDDDEDESISTPFSLKESIVLVERHLGIDFNCLGYITNKIKKQYYRNRKQHGSHLFDITSCLLLVNPDHTTCYNDRRRCLLKMITEKQRQSQQQQQHQEQEDPLILTFVQEIQYINLLMTQHTKAPSSWSHRKFVVKRLIHCLVARLTSNEDGASSVKQTSSEIQMYTKLQHIIQQELNACSSVATKYPKNYYAWTHRIWTIQLLEEGLDSKNNVSDNGTTVSSLLSLLFKSIVTSEIRTMWKEWIPQHTTDHSAIHYTTQLLKLQLQPSCREDPQQQQEAIKVAKESFAFINQLLEKPNDMVTSNANEGVWILRRNVCSVLWNINGEGGNDDHDTGTIVQKLVVDDIQSVVDGLLKQQRDGRANDVTAAIAASASAATNIHALTFVAWCITNLETIPIKDDDDNENDNIDRQRSDASLIMTSQTKHVLQYALQHHPAITHQMWKQRAVVL